MDTVKEYKIDELLKKAKERNCVLAGISAGAILLSKSGFSDSYILREESDKHEFVEGLNFIDINICPHFHNDEKKQKDLEDNLKKNNKEVYGLENCTALKIEDNKMIVIKSKKDSNVYLCKYEKSIFITGFSGFYRTGFCPGFILSVQGHPAGEFFQTQQLVEGGNPDQVRQSGLQHFLLR